MNHIIGAISHALFLVQETYFRPQGGGQHRSPLRAAPPREPSSSTSGAVASPAQARMQPAKGPNRRRCHHRYLYSLSSSTTPAIRPMHSIRHVQQCCMLRMHIYRRDDSSRIHLAHLIAVLVNRNSVRIWASNGRAPCTDMPCRLYLYLSFSTYIYICIMWGTSLLGSPLELPFCPYYPDPNTCPHGRVSSRTPGVLLDTVEASTFAKTMAPYFTYSESLIYLKCLSTWYRCLVLFVAVLVHIASVHFANYTPYCGTRAEAAHITSPNLSYLPQQTNLSSEPRGL